MPDAVSIPEFDTPERTERLHLVAHLLRNTDTVPCVRGPAGSGKSRFMARLADTLAADGPVALINGAVSDLTAAVCEALGTPVEHWPEAGRGSVPPVILIDEADRLSPAATADLQALHAQGGRVVLAAAALPTGAWSGVALQPVDLPRFTEDQAREFLAVAGQGELAVGDAARLRALYEHADGRPGALLAGMGEAPPAAGGGWKWALGTIVTVVVALVLWQQERINMLFAPAAVPPPAPQTAAPELAPPGPQPETAPERQAKPAEAGNAIPIPPLPTAPPSGSDAIAPALAPSGGAATAETMPAEAAEPVGRGDQAAVADAGALPEAQSGLSDETPSAEAAAPQPLAAPEPTSAPEPEPESRPAPGAEAPAASLAEPAPAAPKPAAEPPTAAADAAAPASPAPAKAVVAAPPDQLAWLRSRPPGHYTLQLTAARERQTVDEFVRRHGLAGNYAVFARDLDGKPWYSLVYGDYPDRDAALRARTKLPAGLGATKAWPRSFASVLDQLPPDADPR